MTNPTGDALKASAAQVLGHIIRLAEMWDLPESRKHDPDTLRQGMAEIAGLARRAYPVSTTAALSPVEQAPQPVATETQPIGFMDVDGLGALVDEVRARSTPTEAPPVESQGAEIARLRDALETIALNMHGSNPSLAYADVPREDYLAHVLWEARQLARAALAVEGSAE